MRKIILFLISILFLFIGNSFGAFKMNPFSGQLDYYEPATGGASSLSVEEDDVQISSPTASIDFRDGLDVTESPTGEANVVVDPDEVISTGTYISWDGHTLNVNLSTGVVTQAYNTNLDDLADGTLSASKIEDKFLRNYEDDSSSYKLTVSSLAVTNQTTLNTSLNGLAKLTSGVVSAVTDNSTNWDTAYTHSQNNNQAHTDYLKNDADDTTNYKITTSSLTVTNNATIGSLSSSGQVSSNGNKVIDVYDYAVCISTPITLGTVATLISPMRQYAVTITTITAHIKGGTNFVFSVEQRAKTAPDTSGTAIWTGNVTATTTGWTGGTASDFTVPANYGLYLIPVSVSGNVDRFELIYTITKD